MIVAGRGATRSAFSCAPLSASECFATGREGDREGGASAAALRPGAGTGLSCTIPYRSWRSNATVRTSCLLAGFLPSIQIAKSRTFPPRLHPKHFQILRSRFTENDGDFFWPL